MADRGFKRAFRGDGDGFFSPHTPWRVARVFASECLGTFILLLVGCMGLMPLMGKGETQPHFACAITFGLAVMMCVMICAHTSDAHVNPAVTVCALILGRMRITTFFVYLIAQCIGATLSVGMLRVLTPANEKSKSGCCDTCVTQPGPGVSDLQAFLVEFCATAILVFVVCSVWDRRTKSHDSVAIKFGLAVGGLASAGGSYSGCSMNPARSLAPAIWSGTWTSHWVYWAGPISGSIFATFFYMYLLDNDCSRAKEPEDVPLSNVDGKRETE